MKQRLHLPVAVLALSAVCGVAPAADAPAERERIRVERAQAEQRYVVAERDCNTRFVVTACVEAARAQRRDALGRLRNEELVLDRAERRQRAGERAAAIRDKQAHEDAARAAPRAPLPVPAASAPPSRLHLRPHDAKAGRAERRLSPEVEARNRAAYEARLREAQEHREAIERRNAERQAKAKKPSLPLPLPPTAAGSDSAR
jgi:colicin import membrane protein